ncbi:MAG: M2 family metallopeptidase, partial [Gammaproteobacteria bacterium]|nr:M2 family metallopeptidase [Gammaproteobacteria bacterium]
MNKLLILISASFLIAACGGDEPAVESATDEIETAEAFIDRINDELGELSRELGAAGWVRATYITEDTAILNSLARERYAKWHSNAVKAASRYDDQELSPEIRRALNKIKLGTTLPTPDDAAKRRELTRLATDLTGMYGAGEYCRNGNECFGISDMELMMAELRDYDELLDIWTGWRTVSPAMRDKYRRYVELGNEGANELGYSDMGEMWRAKYDMSPDAFSDETLRLWQQVEPLYEELHCHVRAKLGEHYGEDKVPQEGPIPAHLLGNMWAQQWSSIYELLEPYPGVSDLDVDSTLAKKNYSPQEMVRSAENFYVSLGMPRLPDTFWER